MKRDRYFRKFEGMEPGEEAELPLLDGRERRKVLWIDDELAEGTTYRACVDKVVPLIYKTQDDMELLLLTYAEAQPEIDEGNLSLVILAQAHLKDVPTFDKIKGTYPDVPIIYCIPDTMSGVAITFEKSHCIIRKSRMPLRLGELIDTYALK